MLPAYFNSLTPAPRVNPAFSYEGPDCEIASYGDMQDYLLVDRITLLGPLGLHDLSANNLARWEAIRWAQIYLPPGGSAGLSYHVRDSNSFIRGMLYFLLFDPTAPDPSDPRSTVPTLHFAQRCL